MEAKSGTREPHVPPVHVTETHSWVLDEMDTSDNQEGYTIQPNLYTTTYTLFGLETRV